MGPALTEASSTIAKQDVITDNIKVNEVNTGPISNPNLTPVTENPQSKEVAVVAVSQQVAKPRIIANETASQLSPLGIDKPIDKMQEPVQAAPKVEAPKQVAENKLVPDEDITAMQKELLASEEQSSRAGRSENLFSNMDFGPLKKYLEDDDITDISYSNGGQLWLKTLSKGIFRSTEQHINDAKKIAFQCSNVMGKTFNMAHHYSYSQVTSYELCS